MQPPSSGRLGLPLWLFTIATTISLTGGFAQRMAVGWSAWEMTHMTGWVAAVALADLLPTVVVSAPAGALVDRFRPARSFWASQIASASQAAALCVIGASGHLSIMALIACAGFLGVCNAFTLPARFAYMTELTPDDCYRRAMALFFAGR
jgi:MFS family permease